jgi:hypothetical protein
MNNFRYSFLGHHLPVGGHPSNSARVLLPSTKINRVINYLVHRQDQERVGWFCTHFNCTNRISASGQSPTDMRCAYLGTLVSCPPEYRSLKESHVIVSNDCNAANIIDTYKSGAKRFFWSLRKLKEVLDFIGGALKYSLGFD